MVNIDTYIQEINNIYKTGQATEHSYRPALKALFGGLDEKIDIINEPKRIACGAPDFSFLHQDTKIEIGYAEAKNIDVDIHHLKGKNKEQQKRYKHALSNLLYTNGLDFVLFRNEEAIRSISIGRIDKDSVIPDASQFEALENLLRIFIIDRGQVIVSAKSLAEKMAYKARLIQYIIASALQRDISNKTESKLWEQYESFKAQLRPNITVEEFAGIYAETIAHGLLAARWHDDTPDDFTREKAVIYVPESNKFLFEFFTYITGTHLDYRISWIVDNLVSIFAACNLQEMMADFERSTDKDDPFIHFYESFLSAYDTKKRKARGVWYTPQSVVSFIIRAVDDVLKTEFSLTAGLADESLIDMQRDDGTYNRVHRVQILDPATGTGTFLSEVIEHIACHVDKIASAGWSQYVEEHLIPRLHGFELLMASYTICHLRLEMKLRNKDYKPVEKSDPTYEGIDRQEMPRLQIYLTNALEQSLKREPHFDFARWLAKEAEGADKIKDELPIMCIIGNPPYSGISQDMQNQWMNKLIEDYKYVNGVHFNERKHWLNDDYVRFIRFSEYMIEKNGEGVLGFITNHGYLDNPTFRGMRYHLLKTFDAIHILDLHGNAKKKEIAPDGSVDKNVFDIQQGVAIIIGVKKKHVDSEDKPLAQIYHTGLWGKREDKYQTLQEMRIGTKAWIQLTPQEPFYFFIPRDEAGLEEYQKGFAIHEFMKVNVTGIVTARDSLVISYTKEELVNNITAFRNPKKTDEAIRAEFFPNKKAGKYLAGDSRGWELSKARVLISEDVIEQNVREIAYRPFDNRFIYYSPNMVDWGREKVMRHMLANDNLGLCISRSAIGQSTWQEVQVTEHITEFGIMSTRPGNGTPLFPLYLYEATDGSKRVNFDKEIYQKICDRAGLFWQDADTDGHEQVIFDYIYGVLHSHHYREKYASFLKIDFPHIPYPKKREQFNIIRDRGSQLRCLHLMDFDMMDKATDYPFKGEGDSIVGTHKYYPDHQRVSINDGQYFDTVPSDAWDFYIGGYQPARKWLKDRKNRRLSYDDIRHYQNIIHVLSETKRIMDEEDTSCP